MPAVSLDRRALREIWPVFVGTRLLVAAVAIASAQLFRVQSGNDDPKLTQPFGEVGDAVFAPLARWDSVWYLSIAHRGYDDAGGFAAVGESRGFFPLYPLLVELLAPVDTPGVLLVTAVIVSLACFLGALYVLHRLTALELGPRAAGATVLLLACFPGAVFYGVPMAESLFLLLTVGAFYCARTGRWATAGALAAGASATRSVGFLLLVPLALLYLYGPREDRPPSGEAPPRWRPRYALRRDALWLLLAPAGVVVWSVHLAIDVGDPLYWAHAQERSWDHRFLGPIGGLGLGSSHAASALGTFARDLVPGGGQPRWEEPVEVLTALITLGGLAAAVALFARLPVAYGAWVACALALPLSTPTRDIPLASFPRYIGVLFPVFMLLGAACDRRRLLVPVVAVFTGLLVIATFRYALAKSFGLSPLPP